LGGGLSEIFVLICCRLDSACICWWIYTKLWKNVSNSKHGWDWFSEKSVKGITFFGGVYVVTCIAPSFIDWFTWNFEKVSVRVKGITFLGGGLSYISWLCCRHYNIVGRRGVSWACSLKVLSCATAEKGVKALFGWRTSQV
jgi:hypothetical protein